MKKRLLTLTFLVPFFLFGQNRNEEQETQNNIQIENTESSCGTDEPTNSEISKRKTELSTLKSLKSKRLSNNGYEIKLVPVTYHVFQDDDGSNGITTAQIEAAMLRVNDQYKAAGIEFFACGSIKYYKNTDLNDWNKNVDDSKISGYHVANTLNIYFANSVTSGSSGICGYAYFPSPLHYTVMKNSCAYNGTTFEHELGHYYNLYHTHQGSGSEIVARPGEGKPYNCDNNGDGFCDTEADPSLTGITLVNCVPDAGELGVGPNGDQYRTKGDNIMGYAGTKSCRSVFTSEQLAMMNLTVTSNSYRNNYTCPDSPIANFSANKQNDCIQSTITFMEESTGSGNKTFLWTFEGGTPSTSTDPNPTITYPGAGEFDVTLKVTTVNGTNTITKTDFVKITYPINLPYSENFSSGTSLPSSIATETSLASSATVSSAAGKTDNGIALVGGSGVYYTYANETQTFISNTAYTSVLKLSCINATKYSSLSFSFDYLPLFDAKDVYTSARVLVNGTVIGNYIQPADAGAETWTNYALDLSAYSGAYVDIAIEVNGKTSNNGLYIDNINLDGNLVLSANSDAGIETVSEPNGGADYCSSAITPNVSVKNFSSNPLTSIVVNYNVDGVQYPSVTKTGLNITGNSSGTVTLPTLSGLGFGNHTFKVFTSNPNGNSDAYALNDTAQTNFSIGGGVLGLENFDSQSSCGTGSDCESTTCPITGNWYNESGNSDDIDWRVDAGGTPSSGTGPSADHTSGSDNYIYLETSTCYGKTAKLTSKCIDLSKYSAASLNFWYHLNGANMGSLSVDVLEGGNLISDVFTISGDQGDSWKQQNVNLSAFLGNSVQLIFRGVSGSSYTSDMALDDIEVTGTLKVDTTVTVVGDLMICQGSTTTLVATSNSQYTYQWTKNGVDIPSATNSTYAVTETGNYAVRVDLQGNSLTSNTRSIVVDICTGIKKTNSIIQVYPNPTNGVLYISYPEGKEISKTTVINQQGQVVMNIQGAVKAMDLSNLAPGIYNVQLIIEGDSVNKTIIKK